MSQMWMFGQMPRICQTGLLSQITCQCLISDWLSDSWWTSDVLQKLNTALICLVRDDLIEFSVSSYLTRKEIESYNPFLLLFTRKDNVNSRDSGYAELMNYQFFTAARRKLESQYQRLGWLFLLLFFDLSL